MWHHYKIITAEIIEIGEKSRWRVAIFINGLKLALAFKIEI
jgi:hypothetical protein